MHSHLRDACDDSGNGLAIFAHVDVRARRREAQRSGLQCLAGEQHHLLAFGLDRDRVLGAVDIAKGCERVAVVLVQDCQDVIGQRREEVLPGEVRDLSGLREDRNVRRVAACRLGVDQVGEVTCTGVLNVDARRRREHVECSLHGSSLYI